MKIKIENKSKLIAANASLLFWQGFYLSCSNSSCLKDGNSDELMMSLFIAIGSSVSGIVLSFMLASFFGEPEKSVQKGLDFDNHEVIRISN